ncbi:trichohyalin [Drosophila takahashii]|uniref:trichohyalin n=1 Tax=Drosophila takahashii TaxID=29030 RepID=UPI001CF8DF7F|nr:trichohyalin [Drosophila takahashii]
MSYQIKSTPYFRRMFNNSKKNGQLQRLRDEYERIQEFNDRTIELKMRQVRLKRLFREIEELKAGSASENATGGAPPSNPKRSLGGSNLRRRNHYVRLTNTTPEQKIHEQRIETLARARELGKEISRRNAQMAEAGTGGFLRSELRLTAKMQAVEDARKDAVERRERAAKRISYGNDQSRQNLQRLLLVRQRKMCAGNRSHPQPHPQPNCQAVVPLPITTQQLPRMQIRPSHLYPDYRQLTASQLQLLAVEDERSAEQQRMRRDQEEDERQLKEEQLRQQEDQEDQEDSSVERFRRQDSSMPSQEIDDEDEDSEEQRIIQLRLQNPELADELERRRRRQQEDEEEEEQLQRRLRHLHDETSPLRLARISLSSTVTEGTNATNVTVETAATSPYQGDSVSELEEEVHTAPLANTVEDPLALGQSSSALISFHQPTRRVPFQPGYDSPMNSMCASSKWRQISLMMPWFKAFPDLKSERETMTPAPASNQATYTFSHVATQAEEEPFPPPPCEFLLSTFDFIGTAER